MKEIFVVPLETYELDVHVKALIYFKFLLSMLICHFYLKMMIKITPALFLNKKNVVISF